MRRVEFVLLMVLVLAVVGCVQGGNTEEDVDPGVPSEGLDGDEEARAFYEGLTLDTPEDAVRTLTDAWAENDYETVYFVLAPQAQAAIREQFSLASFEPLLDEQVGDDVSAEMLAAIEDSEEDIWVLFDDIMEIADSSDGLLLDLGGEVSIQNTEASLTATGQDAVDVIAQVEGIEGDVTFRTVQSEAGPWRVFKVLAPGADVEQFPWPSPSTQQDVTEDE